MSAPRSTAAPPLVWYITAHGNGHAVRSCDILNAFHARRPDIPLTLVTDVPASFLRNRLPMPQLEVLPGSFDVGVAQRDSVRGDLPATLAALNRWLADRPARLAAEREFLARLGARLVVADLPGIPLAAAAEMGVPALGIGNFTWNWIYEHFARRDPRWQAPADAYRADYSRAARLLRLPFHEPMDAFPRVTDVPVVARPGRARRADLARATGADTGKPWVLLSFSTLEWDAAALDRVAALRDFEFFTVRPLAWDRPNLHAVERERFPFADVLASCDAVATKPGFGIVSECVVNDKPMVYAEREDFAEYAVLEAAIHRHLRHRRLSAASLYRGDLGDALRAALAAPEPADRPPAGGDRIAAEILDRVYETGTA